MLGHFEPGEHLAIWAHNLPEWLLVEYGAALAGLTLVTVNPSFQPAEVAYVLGQSRARGVLLVGVIGLPDEKWGEIVAAFVRPVDPARAPTVAELRAHLRDHISPQKTPTLWFAVDAYPLTGSGKIQKFAIREAWEKGVYEKHALR